jgi:CRP/FNR family cyclic AMP-dependent transcriptional regulator
VRADKLYILKSGGFEVVRSGVRVVRITGPGAFIGEMSALLGSSPGANVVATQDSSVYVVNDATATVHRDSELTLAIARLLARRLQAVTTYLVDIKRQYAASDTHLALMDEVLASLIAMQPAGGGHSGSERADMPDY